MMTIVIIIIIIVIVIVVVTNAISAIFITAIIVSVPCTYNDNPQRIFITITSEHICIYICLQTGMMMVISSGLTFVKPDHESESNQSKRKKLVHSCGTTTNGCQRKGGTMMFLMMNGE